jgi:kinesin family protein C1
LLAKKKRLKLKMLTSRDNKPLLPTTTTTMTTKQPLPNNTNETTSENTKPDNNTSRLSTSSIPIVTIPNRPSFDNSLNTTATTTIQNDTIMQQVSRLASEFQTVANPMKILEEQFGNSTQRLEYDSAILKRTPPEQRLFGYAKEYIAAETKRLADGYRTLSTKRDTLATKLSEHQHVLDFRIQTILQLTARMSNELSNKIRELSESEARALAARRQAGLAKGLALKGEEAMQKLQQTEEETNQKLSTAEKARLEAIQREEEARRRADAAEQVAAATSRALAHAREETLLAQNQTTKIQAELKSKFEPELRSLTEKLSTKEEEIIQYQRSIADMTNKYQLEQTEVQRLRQELEKLQTLSVALRERAEAAESKLNSHEGTMEKALTTLSQNQVFAQERIQSLSDEKIRLEHRVEELSKELSHITNKMFEANSTSERLREQISSLNERISQLVAAKEIADRMMVETASKLEETKADLAVKTSKIEDYIHKLNEVRTNEASNTAKLLEMTSKLEEAKSDAAIKTSKWVDAKDALDRCIENVQAEKIKAEKAMTECFTLKNRIENLETELTATRTAYESAKDALHRAQTTSSTTTTSITSSNTTNDDESLNKLLEMSKETETLKRRVGDINTLKEELSRLQAKLDETTQAWEKSEHERRKLLEELQTLKGNVRVIARVRPPTQTSQDFSDQMIKCSMDGTSLTVSLDAEQTRNNRPELHQFNFNRVFSSDATQITIFDEVSQFVQSALDGYHVCLFSYGQTGSGKSYTMMGPSREADPSCNPSLKGIIPRSVDQMFRVVAESRELGFEYTIEVTYVEIYNENIRDLLGLDQKAEISGAIKHDIIHRGGDVMVTNLRRVLVKDSDRVQELIAQAERNRSVASTDKNHESSRSHSIFTAHIISRNKNKSSELVGSLNLCDLAGSERLKASNVAGDRLKETLAINTSLSALNKVFTALQQKQSHIPIRDSTLTHMLSPCLCGEGKTLMIVNLSSDLCDASESISSLKFAQAVNKTELGKAKKNVRDDNISSTSMSAPTSSSTTGTSASSNNMTSSLYRSTQSSAMHSNNNGNGSTSNGGMLMGRR